MSAGDPFTLPCDPSALPPLPGPGRKRRTGYPRKRADCPFPGCTGGCAGCRGLPTTPAARELADAAEMALRGENMIAAFRRLRIALAAYRSER